MRPLLSSRFSRRQSLQLGLTAGAAALLAACQSPETPAAPLPALTLIARDEWGAAAPNLEAAGEHGLFDERTNPTGWLEYDQPLSTVLTTLVVHHSASVLDGPRDIQKLHMHTRG